MSCRRLRSTFLFLRSVDQDYFSPYEAARRAAVLFDSDIETLYRKLRDQEIPIWSRQAPRSPASSTRTSTKA